MVDNYYSGVAVSLVSRLPDTALEIDGHTVSLCRVAIWNGLCRAGRSVLQQNEN